jgi:CrcB protein
MSKLLLIALGGATGSIARYLISTATYTQFGVIRFPLGTLVVNSLGCLVVGILAGLVQKHDLFSDDIRLMLFMGIAGGFTTFSALGLETFELLRHEEWMLASTYVLASVLIGVAMVGLGYALIGINLK